MEIVTERLLHEERKIKEKGTGDDGRNVFSVGHKRGNRKITSGKKSLAILSETAENLQLNCKGMRRHKQLMTTLGQKCRDAKPDC